MFIDHLSIPFCEMPFQVFCPFWYQAVCFFLLICKNMCFVYIQMLYLYFCFSYKLKLGYQFFAGHRIANIFSYSIGCLFILIVSFVVQKLFSLKWSHCLFCFCLPSLRIHIQKILVRPMSKVYCQCFLLVIWGLLCFHMKFRIICSSSVEKKIPLVF